MMPHVIRGGGYSVSGYGYEVVRVGNSGRIGLIGRIGRVGQDG